MRIEDLYDKYGSWSAVAQELKKTPSAINYWRKRGYIPYPAQLVIEKRTKGLFKASLDDAVPRNEG
jgi:hypothetical protein